MKTKTVYVVQSCNPSKHTPIWSDRLTMDGLEDARDYKSSHEMYSFNDWRIIKRTEEVIE